MFNLIVAGNGTHWEAAPLTFGVDRFKEYSDGVADGIDIGEPETLAQLEQIPTLLVYEVGARGPRARTVRYGQLANLRRRGQNLVFDFVPDAEHAYLSQADLFGRSDELGINPFEQHRTHWAIKEGDLPQNLIATGTAELQDRTIQIIANEYGEALRDRNRVRIRTLRTEIEEAPATLDKDRLDRKSTRLNSSH